jgi:hypothetical protein
VISCHCFRYGPVCVNGDIKLLGYQSELQQRSW